MTTRVSRSSFGNSTAHAGHELTNLSWKRHGIKWFWNDSNRSSRQVFVDFVFLDLGSHEYDGNRCGGFAGPQLNQRRRPIHSGHHDVEQNQIGFFLFGDDQGLRPARGQDSRPFSNAFEAQFPNAANMRFIVDEQYFGNGFHGGTLT